MKKPIYIIIPILFSLIITAQDKIDISEEFSIEEDKRVSCWELGQYEKAIESMKKMYNLYLNHESDDKKKTSNILNFENLNYDIARAYSLLNQPDSALVYLQNYYDLAFTSYSTYYRNNNYHISRDVAFNNIRSNQDFQNLLVKFEEKGWGKILKEYKTYNAIESKLTPFIYVDEDWGSLPELKEKYNLDSIAGNGDDVSKILNLMSWVHNTIRHDGNSGEPTDRHADALIELCQTEKKGLNCWMISTVMNEVYLAMGLKSRIVSCYPKGDPFIIHEWHVIVEVFSPSLNKWLWIDPSFETYVKDSQGNLLSIAEVRNNLMNGLPVFASPEINWNNEPYEGGGEQYLYDYMTKNLFRIAIPLFSIPAYEMYPRKIRIYVQLLPEGYNHTNENFHEITGNRSSIIYTTDDKQFWRTPNTI
ncbi:transglutaminase-like domain-containing protein [Candidatus Neomarinimicrobiota bacterium]